MRRIALSLVSVAIAGLAASAATARPAVHPAGRSLPSATTGSTAPLRTGLQDPVLQGAQQVTADAMASDAGATYVRLLVAWNSIAPASQPQGFDPSDPASPGYNWTALDATVAAADAAGLTPMLNIIAPPIWAFSTPPTSTTGGTPQIGALGAFATALATRYNTAPEAHIFEVWNEPNFNKNLYPQDPATYRSMVNAVADSVHGVNSSNLVVAGELAPFKHKPKGADKNSVTSPLTFMREMFCLSPDGTHQTCNTQSEFDVWSHHPYSDTGPFGHATASGGIELGDLPKMKKLLDQAEQAGAISSTHSVQFWVTEFGWSSKPPNTHGVPMTLETRWVAESMYQIWTSGATLATWFLLQDYPLNIPFQSGLYLASDPLANATAKPLLSPFSFPFVAYLKSHGKVLIWGRDATSDKRDVSIQRKSRSGWTTVGTITSNSSGIFTATLPLGAKSSWQLRASASGSGQSTGFALKAPRNEKLHVSPFPLSG